MARAGIVAAGGVLAVVLSARAAAAPDTAEMTIDRLAEAIEAWVAWDAKLHGGYFLVRDEETQAVLELKLERVHRERLSQLDDGIWFTCVEFRARDGSLYDLDVALAAGPGSPFEGLWPAEIAVHGKDGALRYSWQEENGRWTRKALP